MKLMVFLFNLFFLFLASCATITNNNNWQIYHNEPLNFNSSGRISIKIDSRGNHGNFNWDNFHSAQYSQIDFNTPLGNTIGTLCKDKQGVIAQNNKGKRYSGKNSTELSQELLGYEVPLDYLDLWANGFIPENTTYKQVGNALIQNGWTIERIINTDNSPKQLLLKNKDLTITIVFDEFSTTSSSTSDLNCSR